MKTKLLSAILTALLMTSTFVAAVDLGNYPSFLFTDHNLDAYVVVGSAAASADVVGAVDLATRLAGESYEEVSTGGSVSVSGGKKEDILLNTALNAATAFGSTLNYGDIPGLLHSTVTISTCLGGTSCTTYKDTYDVHDELQFTSGIALETGLTSSSPDEDFKSDTFIEVGKSSVKYYYVFDDALSNGNYIANTSDSYPLEIKFLGKTLTITGASDADTMTIQSGDEYSLNVGDSVTVGGKTITLDNVGSGSSVVISVDGTSGTISSGSQKTINGINIKNKEAFYSTEKADRSATILVGEDVSDTVNDGDAYCIGATDKDTCEDDAVWVWDLAGLTGSDPTIGVMYNKQLDEADEVIGMGKELALPNDYMKIKLDSYVETDYRKYTVESDEIVDLYWGTYEAVDTKHTLHINGAGGSKDSLETETGSHKTDDLYFYYNTTLDSVQVFYKDTSDNKIKYVDVNASDGAAAAIGYFTFQDTRLELDLSWNAVNDNGTLVFKTANGDDLTIMFEKDGSSGFSYLGQTDGDTAYANDLLYGTTDISGWEEDTRTENGIVVYDPKAHLSGDSFEFDINGDESDFKVNVVVLGPSGSTTSGDKVKKVVPITNAVAKLDTEVSLPVGKNLVLVGGPAVNKLTATALGLTYPTYGSQQTLFAKDEGYIKLTKDVVETGKYALVVAGWEAKDTRNACSVLQQFGTFETQLTGKMAVKVTAVSASGITAAS